MAETPFFFRFSVSARHQRNRGSGLRHDGDREIVLAEFFPGDSHRILGAGRGDEAGVTDKVGIFRFGHDDEGNRFGNVGKLEGDKAGNREAGS